MPALPYAYDALEPHIDVQTMRIHHDKHHAGYVKNLNEAISKEASLKGKSLYLNGEAKVIEADVTASNGVIHVIDKVILPPSK